MPRRITSVADLIKTAEGCVLSAKKDSRGWEIGWGHNTAEITDGMTCTQDEADAWLAQDIDTAVSGAIDAVGLASWKDLDEVRRAALTDMAYELGSTGLAEFKRMIAEIRGQNWRAASVEGFLSRWAEQVPSRARRDMMMLRTGEWPFSA